MSFGSLWRKWDLHVHTPESYENSFRFIDQSEADRYNSNLWAKYIDELEKVEDISVIGITDYFSIEGNKKVKEYIDDGRLANFDLILPNIELRLDVLDPQSRRINYHVIFDNQTDINCIEKDFLEALTFKNETGEPRKLTRVNIEAVGKTLKSHHSDFLGESDYVVGCKHVAVSLDEVISVLEAQKTLFQDKYLLVLAEAGWDDWNWSGQGHIPRKNLLIASDAIFTSNRNTREWALGKRYESRDQFLDEFKAFKPCIHGSDAHKFEDICEPAENRFCWIKADPTFNGLRQILFEPEDRVVIRPNNPEPRKNIYSIKKIGISNGVINKDLTLQDQELDINKNMVVITGGKGDGKTAFVDLIANCFENRRSKSNNDKNSFVKRIEGEKKDLEVALGFYGDDIPEFRKLVTDDRYFEESIIRYLPQGKIEEFCSDTQLLNDLIQDIIVSNYRVKELSIQEEYNRYLSIIIRIRSEIQKINQDISVIEESTGNRKELVTQRRIKEGELKNKQNELSEIVTNIDDIKLDKLQKEERKLRECKERYIKLLYKMIGISDRLENFTEEFNNEIEPLNADMGELGLFLIPEFNTTWVNYFINLNIDKLESDTKELQANFEIKKKEIEELDGMNASHLTVMAELEILKKELEELDNEIRSIDDELEKKKRFENDRLQKYADLINTYFQLKDSWDEVIKTFMEGQNEIMTGISFESVLDLDQNKYIEIGIDIFDKRSVSVYDIQKCIDVITHCISNHDEENIGEYLKEKYLSKLGNLIKNIKGSRDIKDTYQWYFRDYFSLNTNILFKGIALEKLSMGQKGTVLLKLFLAEGDTPLILDQPEENLDNKFIYEELVDAFRQAKSKRQIIIATNNANLVVNTDSEQIIIAEFVENKISYLPCTIEDIGMRLELTRILEGGEVAFKKREDKYGFKSK